MPLYQFACEECEDTFDGFKPAARSSEKINCPWCDAPASRVFAAPGGHSAACWPKESIALSVHSTQAKEANEQAAKAGLATRYKDDGTAVIPSRAEQAKLVKARGMFNRGAGYGD